MSKKETIVFFVAALGVFFCGFFVGSKYTDAMQNQLSYQIKIKASQNYPQVSDSIIVFDEKRKVGTVALDYNEPFAAMILQDNE